jgi:hypothetical protein
MKARKFFLLIWVICFFSPAAHLLAMYMDAKQEGVKLFQSIIDHGIADHALIDEAAAEQEAQGLISAQALDLLAHTEESTILETGFMLAINNNLFWLAKLYRQNGAYQDRDRYSYNRGGRRGLTWVLNDVAQDGTFEQFEFILSLGAAPILNWLSFEERPPNPIVSCTRNQSEAEALKMIPLLARRQVNLDYAGGGAPCDGTALHSAAAKGSIPLIKLLVQLGANSNNADAWNHATPLDHLVLNMRCCDSESRAETLKSSCKLLFQYGAKCKKEKLEDCVSAEFLQECRQARTDYLARQKTYAYIASRADYKQVGGRAQYYQGFYVGQLDKIFRSLEFKPANMVGVEMPAPSLTIIADYSGNLAGQEEFAIMENRHTREPEKTCVVQ